MYSQDYLETPQLAPGQTDTVTVAELGMVVVHRCPRGVLMWMSCTLWEGRGGAEWRDRGLASVTTPTLPSAGHLFLSTVVVEVSLLSSAALWSQLGYSSAVRECKPDVLLQSWRRADYWQIRRILL